MRKQEFKLHQSDGRAWAMAGAPVLALAGTCMLLAVVLLWSFARKQDESFARYSEQLVRTAYEGQLGDTARVALDYAVWNDAYENVTLAWSDEWVESNYYSSIADGIFVVRGDGTVRHAWLAEGVGAQDAFVTGVAHAAVSALDLKTLADAVGPEGLTASTVAVVDGRPVLISIAPISAEEATVRLARNGALPVDYLLALDVLSPADLAQMGERLGIAGLSFAGQVGGPERQSLTLIGADGALTGALVWPRQRPGSAAFLGDASTILLVLLVMGLAATLLARRMVAAQTRAAAEVSLAQEASRMKSEFMSTMSHELRTPLNAILGYGGLIQEESADLGSAGGAIYDDAERLLVSARHLTRLVNDVLDQARIDAGRLNLACEPVNVRTVLSELEEMMAPLAAASGNTFTAYVDSAAEEVFADPLRLNQCLVNLVANALKFTRDGTVSLTVTAAPGGRGFISFEVADTGIGIAPEEMKNLFKPFAQANHSVAAKFGGTGLGLSISRSLARAMDGDIMAESAPGDGSVFTLVLPARAPEAHAPAAAKRREAA